MLLLDMPDIDRETLEVRDLMWVNEEVLGMSRTRLAMFGMSGQSCNQRMIDEQKTCIYW